MLGSLEMSGDLFDFIDVILDLYPNIDRQTVIDYYSDLVALFGN